MAVCCCALAGTAACQHCANNPFATDVWTNKTVTVDHIEAKPFGNGLDVCPVCGKPSTIGKPQTNADRIRSMTDEELAEWLKKQACLAHNYGYECADGEPDFPDGLPANYDYLAWLKKEVTDDNNS